MSAPPVPGRIDVTIPILPAQDLAATEAFYAGLGFARPGAAHEGYLLLERDQIEIHFWLCPDRAIAEQSGCYVRTPDADALFAEFQAAGIWQTAKLLPVQNREWGMREFYVIDPNGNLLRFGQYLS